MDAQLQSIAAAAGGVLSLLLKYMPWVKDWFEKQTSAVKSIVVISILAAGAFVFYVSGDLEAADAVLAAITGLIGSQATHTITRKL